MAKVSKKTKKVFGVRSQTVNLFKYFNLPHRVPKDEWWQNLAERIRDYPTGMQYPWGIPFKMAQGEGLRVIMITKDIPELTVPLNGLILEYFREVNVRDILLRSWKVSRQRSPIGQNLYGKKLRRER